MIYDWSHRTNRESEEDTDSYGSTKINGDAAAYLRSAGYVKDGYNYYKNVRNPYANGKYIDPRTGEVHAEP